MVTDVSQHPPRRAPTPPRPDPAAAPLLAGGLSVTVETHRRTTVIRLRGSLRCATAATLRQTVETVLATGPATVVLDLAEVVADDELGLWVLPAMAGDAQRVGVPLVVVAPARDLRSRLRRLGARPIDITDTAPTGTSRP